MGEINPEEAAQIFQDAGLPYLRLLRAREQLVHAQNLSADPFDAPRLSEFRRRIEWVLSLPEFARDFSWESLPASSLLRTPAIFASQPYELGLNLLQRFHPRLTIQDMELYERARAIGGHHIAFDIDKTLVELLEREAAEAELKENPEKYDGVNLDYFVHQATRWRMPYRGIQATLMGLFVAGNTLRLNTQAKNEPTNLELFLNDFPLLKIVFGLVPPEDPFRPVSAEDLSRSPQVMDSVKRKEFYERHFNSPDGERFLQALREDAGGQDLAFHSESKIPFPDFWFELLVDDKEIFGDQMETSGFGRRSIKATGSVPEILQGIEEFFHNPPPETSQRLQAWLKGKTNPLTPPHFSEK